MKITRERANELGLTLCAGDCLSCDNCYDCFCTDNEAAITEIIENGFDCPEFNPDRLKSEMTEEEYDAYRHNRLIIVEDEPKVEAKKKFYFLKDLYDGSVDAVIIAKTSTAEEIAEAIMQTKEKDGYEWADIVDALPEDCEIYDRWSDIKDIWY